MVIRKYSYASSSTTATEPFSRLLKVFLLLSMFFLLFIGGIVFLKSSYMAIKNISVSGNVELADATILQSANIDSSGQLYAVNLADVAHRVSEIAWVETVKVNRSWDGTISLDVDERVAIAAIANQGSYTLIDSSGIVLAETDTLSSRLPILLSLTDPGNVGNSVSDDALGFVDLLLELSADSRSRLNNFTLSDGQILAELDDSSNVLFGAGEEYELKSLSLETVLDKVDMACVTSINLIVADSPTVTRDSDCDLDSL